MPLPSPSAVPVLEHWETYAAACAAGGQVPVLGPFAAWLAARVAPPAPPVAVGPARAQAAVAAAVNLWRSARRLRALYAAAAPMGGPSPDEFLLLHWAVKRPGGPKSAAFGYAGLGATTGGQMLARLAARGWLTEGPDPADGRRTCVAPTPAGHAAMTAAAAVFTAAAEALAAPLAGPDLQRLQRLLHAVKSAPTGPSALPG